MASWNVSTHLTCVHKNKPFCWIFSEWENNEAQSTFFVTQAYLPFGSDVFQLPTSCSNHVVKKTLKLSLAFFSRELMTWGPLVDNEQWERCFWFDSDFLLEFCGKITLFEKSKILSKNSILTKPQHFHEFFTQIFFWQFFSWNQSCQQLKSAKPQHFHEFFTPPKNRQFSREIKVEFLDKKFRKVWIWPMK